jgi:hypothetical protein
MSCGRLSLVVNAGSCPDIDVLAAGMKRSWEDQVAIRSPDSGELARDSALHVFQVPRAMAGRDVRNPAGTAEPRAERDPRRHWAGNRKQLAGVFERTDFG